MNFEHSLKEKIKTISGIKKIVLIDGDDQRTVKAAQLLKEFNNLELFLLIEKPQEKVEGINFININEQNDLLDQYATRYVELRKGKETLEQAYQALKTRPVWAMMMLDQGLVDGVVGGLLYPTADILRAAFKVIGPAQGIKTISSAMIMHKDDSNFVFSDISVNVKPNAEQLAEIGINAQRFAEQIGLDSKVAFLSFSTSFSAKTPESELVKEATDLFNDKTNFNKAIGEIQLDAAIDMDIRKSKYKDQGFNEPANVLIFPDLNAGNIGYKLVQRFAGYGAIGPVVVGTKKPVNDLSRGSTINDVVNTVLITVLQSLGDK